MNRRDFLLLRRERDLRVVELSCRTLYMRLLDTQMTGAAPADIADPDPWGHEPPAVLDKRGCSDLFAEINNALQDADVLRIADEAWLTDATLRDQVQLVIVEFVARGGRVELADAHARPVGS